MSSISDLKVYATRPHPCSYLDGRVATTVFIDPEIAVDQETYTALSDIGFRRSGPHIYRPQCENCTACVPARIPVDSFKPNRQQRKTKNKNSHIVVEEINSIEDDKYYQLYDKYIRLRHADGDMYPPDKEQYQSFLTAGLGFARYYQFTHEQKLIAVAVTDRLMNGLSAIYTFFDPDYGSYSPGKFAILWQIDRAKELGLPYLYLGYWIKQCSKMSYKTDYRPLELFINDRWQTLT